MAKTDAPNRFGIPGLGHVAADPFMSTDNIGRGQHGGLGPYETNPWLSISGEDFSPGVTEHPSRTIDIAPTILRHLGVEWDGMDGEPLPHA